MPVFSSKNIIRKQFKYEYFRFSTYLLHERSVFVYLQFTEFKYLIIIFIAAITTAKKVFEEYRYFPCIFGYYK